MKSKLLHIASRVIHSRWVAALIVAFVVSYCFNIINDNNIDRVRDAELRSCERVQRLRDSGNATNLLIYETFKSVESQQKALWKSGANEQIRENARKSYLRAKHIGDTTTIIGPTDCKQAINNPGSYKPPTAEPIESNSPRVQEAIKRAQPEAQ